MTVNWGECVGGCGEWKHSRGSEVTPPSVGKGNRNPGSSELSFHSPISGADSVHTLTCAIMLLNTDLHGQVRQWRESLWELRLGLWQGVRGGEDQRPETGQGTPLRDVGLGSWKGFHGGWLGGYSIGMECVLKSSHFSMDTEHWEEHELPGIHNQPERAEGWRELPQGAAEGMCHGSSYGLRTRGSLLRTCSLGSLFQGRY